MSNFDLLNAELDQWNFSGEEAVLWWRDDDAETPSPALDRLIALACQYDVPVALAAIPEGVGNALSSMVADNKMVQILQHGYSHQNYAPAKEKKQELGVHRDRKVIAGELSTGFEYLRETFGGQFVPALVPPWNRIADPVVQELREIGFLGLSCYAPRKHAEIDGNIWVVNTHADIINWKQNKEFIGESVVIDQLIRHLCDRREGRADKAEPTGLLTHHLVHNEKCWGFLENLFSILDDHPAATWLSAERVFQTSWRQPEVADSLLG